MYVKEYSVQNVIISCLLMRPISGREGISLRLSAMWSASLRVKLGRKVVKTATGEEKEVKVTGVSLVVILPLSRMVLRFKQDLPLVMGDNVIGRRNKDTEGVDVPIITSDPSMGRKHCVINVKKDTNGKFVYMVRDFPSLTGTFVKNVLVGKKNKYVSGKVRS